MSYFVCLSVFLSVWMSFSLSGCLSDCLSVSSCDSLSVPQSDTVGIFLSLSVYLPLCRCPMSICLSFCLWHAFYLSFCLRQCICLIVKSVYLYFILNPRVSSMQSICLLVSISLSDYFFSDSLTEFFFVLRQSI